MYMHVTIHTAQTWADMYISELNDTHVEYEERIRFVPPRLEAPQVAEAFRSASRRRLLVLGYNATLTQAIEEPLPPNRHFAQIKVPPLLSHSAGPPFRPGPGQGPEASGGHAGLGIDSETALHVSEPCLLFASAMNCSNPPCSWILPFTDSTSRLWQNCAGPDPAERKDGGVCPAACCQPRGDSRHPERFGPAQARSDVFRRIR